MYRKPLSFQLPMLSVVRITDLRFDKACEFHAKGMLFPGIIFALIPAALVGWLVMFLGSIQAVMKE